MKTNKYTLLTIVISLIFTLTVYQGTIAQVTTQELGVFANLKYKNENLPIINGKSGELISLASVGEPIIQASISDDEINFYIITMESIYKGIVSTGEIVDQFKFNNSTLDPEDPMAALEYVPLAITNDGLGVYTHKEDVKDFQNNNEKLYTANINTKSIKEVYDISDKKINIGAVQRSKSNPLKFIKKINIADLRNWTIKTIDLVSGELTNEIKVDMNKVLSLKKELEDFQVTSLSGNGNLIHLNFIKPNHIGGVSLDYNQTTNEIVLYNKYSDPMKITSQLIINYDSLLNEYIFSKKECSFPPQPKATDYDFLADPGGASKQMLKDQAKWQKELMNPENCNVLLSNSNEFDDIIIEIPKTFGATLVNNNKHIIVNRIYETVLIEIESGEKIWSVDTDF